MINAFAIRKVLRDLSKITVPDTKELIKEHN